jgi:uncharacterized RDD family membrane protein YckC
MAGVVRCYRCQQHFCRNCVVALRGQYYCAACKGQQVRDIQSGTEAGVLELASIGRRFGAMWVDGMLALVVMIPLMIVLGVGFAAAGPKAMQNETAMGGMMLVVMVVLVAVVTVYEGLMLSSRGQTVGKMVTGIKVVSPEGRDISRGQAWGRAVLRQIFFSYLALINYLPALMTKQKTAVHDIACKTRVVRARR